MDRTMYADDTFFSLSMWARTGLAVLSGLLALATLYVANLVYRRALRAPLLLSVVARLMVAVAILWLFIWLTPQVYYAYYQTFIPSLPNQIVVQWPPGPLRLAQILSFTGPRAVSEQAKSLLGWMLIALAIHPIQRIAN